MSKARRYPGGKGGCFRNIINFMPPHRTYIETHLGGGNILFNKKMADCSIAIDVDQGLLDSYGEVSGVHFICADASSYLRKWRDDIQSDTLVYCDPPYLMSTRKGGDIYRYEYTDEQHIELLETIIGLRCYVMISGYYSDLYSSMLSGWHLEKFKSMTRQGLAEECLWMNFTPNGVLHEYTYAGKDFRERERIKRKKQRWQSKIAMMDHVEKNAIAEIVAASVSSEKPMPAVHLTMNDRKVK